jgi:hypothetical protein
MEKHLEKKKSSSANFYPWKWIPEMGQTKITCHLLRCNGNNEVSCGPCQTLTHKNLIMKSNERANHEKYQKSEKLRSIL